MSEHKRKHDPTINDDNRPIIMPISMLNLPHVQIKLAEELSPMHMMSREELEAKNRRRTLFTDLPLIRLPSSIPSGTSMLEHKWKHDPTINDKDGLLTMLGQSLMDHMFKEKMQAKLGEPSGTSFTDPSGNRMMRMSSEEKWQEQFRSMTPGEKAAAIHQEIGRLCCTSFTDPSPTRNFGANSSVWAPNPSMDNDRIVSQLVDLPGLGLLVLCKDRPRVEPHSLQTPANCLPFKVQIAKSSQMPQKVFAGDDLKNSDGSPIEIEMIDTRTGSIVSEGPESSAKVTVVVLEGSSGVTGNWIEVKPRDGKPPLLAGCTTVTLKEGKGRFDNLPFTDNSSFVRDKKFRLGFKVDLVSHIQGALSTAICVKDARGKSNVKKEIPEEDDTVDVLVNIAKNGPRLRKLNDCGIKTVKQLSLFYEKDPKALRDVLKDMPKKSFDATIKNAEKCRPVLEPALQMTQNQTMISAGAEEGSAVMMSGDHSKFNVLDNEHNLSLGHPQGDHLNPPAGLPMSSPHSGEPGVVLQSPAFQPPVGTDCLNETAVHTDGIDSETIFRQFLSSLDAVDFSAGSN